MHIYHSRWHQLTDSEIRDLFNRYLNGVSNHPFSVLPALRRLEKATLEVIEDRSRSTVYLVRETGERFQVPQVEDILEVAHNSKPGVFIIRDLENQNFIERLKAPRFIAKYNPDTKEIFDIEWIDQEPFQTTAISTLKKAKHFLLTKVK